MHLLVTSYVEGPAREAMQRSARAFWESIAAAMLQPEVLLQDFAALAWSLHQQGRSLPATVSNSMVVQLLPSVLIDARSCMHWQAC